MPSSGGIRSSAECIRQGGIGSSKLCHLHDATNTHYDLRLQVGGTLKSFAVPKGPSLDPTQKRLAVLTEDHPLEYLDFEDVIPEGNYGAGSMIAWDLGRVVYLDGTAEEGIARGKIDFTLSGFKLAGRFALVETGSRQGKGSKASGKQWLLIKKPDSHKSERDLLVEEPRSVLSGLSIDELAHKAEIAADEQPPDRQTADQHLLDEARRGKPGEARIEPRHVHAIDARGLDQLQLVAQARDPGWRGLPGEEFARMRLESEYAGGQVELARLRRHAPDKHAVASVYAIEVADRQRTPARGALQRAVRDDHGLG